MIRGIDVQQMRERAREVRESVINLLIHRYWEIDPRRVLLYARENLDDLEMFLIQMGQWLGQELYLNTSIEH